jgi:hypothetical protein
MRNNQASGRHAKKQGDLFERILETTAQFQQLNLIRVPNGGQYRKRGGVLKLEATTSPFDYVIQRKGFAPLFFDAKTRLNDSIGYADFMSKESTSRQVLTLIRAIEFGTMSGFVIWFRTCDKIVFVDALKIGKMEPRTSINAADGLLLGSSEKLNLGLLWHDIE